MKRKDFFRIGKITKCNRKTGELSVALLPGTGDVSDHSGFIFFEIDGGLVPFGVKSLIVLDTKTIRLSAVDYDTPEKAQQFVGCRVFVPKADIQRSDDDFFNIYEMIGYEVVDKNAGTIGALTDILEGPQQDLLQVNAGGKEILIPFVDEVFEKADHHRKQIFIDAPDGLIDLYLGT